MAEPNDLGLPKATIVKFITDQLPQGSRLAPEARDLIIDCCTEFIHMVASQANENLEKEKRKTLSGENIISALKELGFDCYTEGCATALEEAKGANEKNPRRRHKNKLKESGLSHDEMIRRQRLLFEASRSRMAADEGAVPVGPVEKKKQEEQVPLEAHEDVKEEEGDSESDFEDEASEALEAPAGSDEEVATGGAVADANVEDSDYDYDDDDF